MELTEEGGVLNSGNGSGENNSEERAKNDLWASGTDLEGGNYDQEEDADQRIGTLLGVQQLVSYATTDPIEPPFTKAMVSEALVVWWAIMSECFGENPPEPSETEVSMKKLQAFMLGSDPAIVARRIYKKIAAVFGMHDFMATVFALRGLRILSKTSIVAGHSYAELGEVDSETLVQRGSDGSLQIYGLKSILPNEPPAERKPAETQ